MDFGIRFWFFFIKNFDFYLDRIYLRINEKNFVYFIEENRWEVVDENIGESECKVENIWYSYVDDGLYWWYDIKYC